MVVSLGLWAIVGSIIGAKLLMVIRTPPEYLAQASKPLVALLHRGRRQEAKFNKNGNALSYSAFPLII